MKLLHQVDVADGSLLEIASGLESVVGRFDGLLDRYVPGERSPGPDDERTLDLILGLVAVRARLRAMLDSARVDTRAAAPAPDALDGEAGSWLR